MDYPKLPNGPFSQGTAAIRSLQSGGATFQTKRGVGFVARQKDDFARVEVDNQVKIVSWGRLKPGKTGLNGATGSRMAFAGVENPRDDGEGTDYQKAPPARSCDFGILSRSEVNYTNLPFAGADIYEATQSVFVGPLGTRRLVAVLNTFSSLFRYIPDLGQYPNAYVKPDAARLHYTGRAEHDGEPQIGIAAFYLSDQGRDDVFGQPEPEPAVSLVFSKAAAGNYLLPMPAADPVPRYSMPLAAVSSSCMFVLVPQKVRPNTTDPLFTKLPPPIWLMVSIDGGATFNAADVRALLIGDATTGMTPEQAFDFFSLFTWDAVLTYWTQHLQFVMCGDGQALISFPYIKANAMWSLKVAKLSGFGTTLTTLYTEETVEFVAAAVYYEAMVFLGENTFLAKKTSVIPHSEMLDDPIAFVRSTDGGTTWTELTPTGLPSAMVNQFYGKFAVEKAMPNSRVLVTSWDAEKEAYYVYASEDAGDTWKRQGRVAKPDTFRRIDSTVEVATDDNPHGTYESLTLWNGRVDPALPDRYARTSP